MHLGENRELVSIEDIFENDEFVVMKAIYKKNSFHISVLSVGFKDASGDIVCIKDVEERYL
ncbi:MAG: hypothetical protein K2J35_05665 [Eubacterium sp.]|nr:hypothetical protein [Eubacterium sp.]